MTLSDKDRKLLWGRAGSRCSICNAQLTQVDGMDVVVGEEAHIRSHRPGGSRYDENQSPRERASYLNHILLCPTHHKVVDDAPGEYTVEILMKLKEAHEQNTARRLDGATVGWVEVPTLVMMLDSTALVDVLSSAEAVVTGHDHPDTDAQSDAIADFLEEVEDWIGDLQQTGARGRMNAVQSLGEQMRQLEEHGLTVFAGAGRWRLLPDYEVNAATVRVLQLGPLILKMIDEGLG